LLDVCQNGCLDNELTTKTRACYATSALECEPSITFDLSSPSESGLKVRAEGAALLVRLSSHDFPATTFDGIWAKGRGTMCRQSGGLGRTDTIKARRSHKPMRCLATFSNADPRSAKPSLRSLGHSSPDTDFLLLNCGHILLLQRKGHFVPSRVARPAEFTRAQAVSIRAKGSAMLWKFTASTVVNK